MDFVGLFDCFEWAGNRVQLHCHADAVAVIVGVDGQNVGGSVVGVGGISNADLAAVHLRISQRTSLIGPVDIEIAGTRGAVFILCWDDVVDSVKGLLLENRTLLFA